MEKYTINLLCPKCGASMTTETLLGKGIAVCTAPKCRKIRTIHVSQDVSGARWAKFHPGAQPSGLPRMKNAGVHAYPWQIAYVKALGYASAHAYFQECIFADLKKYPIDSGEDDAIIR